MNTSFLSALIQAYYPVTAEKIQTLIASNVLLEKLAVSVYEKLEASVQKYADIAGHITVLTRMTQAWRKGEYKDISYTSIFLSVAILLYFISPIDLVPDFIPVIGGLDDVLLLGYLLKILRKETTRFLEWENLNHNKR